LPWDAPAQPSAAGGARGTRAATVAPPAATPGGGPVSPRTAVVLFHRDLRVHDHPALAAACAGAERVVPLFVVDRHLWSLASPNRLRFLCQSLADLRESLRRRGADLVVRRGDPVTEAVRVATACGAERLHVTADVSAYATARQRRLAAACADARVGFEAHPGVTLVPPGALLPAGGGDHYRIFTPYWRVWRQHPWRPEVAAPARIRLPDPAPDPGRLPR